MRYRYTGTASCNWRDERTLTHGDVVEVDAEVDAELAEQLDVREDFEALAGNGDDDREEE